jgi:hypothetical protein
VLYGVGYIDIVAFDASGFERFVQHSTCRANKWAALQIFLISGLLADHHDFRSDSAFTEDGLSTALPKIAPSAALHCFAQTGQSPPCRQKIGC